jgi:hypothetical protein
MSWTLQEGYQQIRGKEWLITLEPRPPYCDRGRFIAKLFQARAKAEIEAWLDVRHQL